MAAFLGPSSFVPDAAVVSPLGGTSLCRAHGRHHTAHSLVMADQDRHLSRTGMFSDLASSVYAAHSSPVGSNKPLLDFVIPADVPRVPVAAKVKLAEKRSVSPAGDTLQLSIDLSSNKKLFSTHTRPGQFVQISLPSKPRCPPCNLVIASPPVCGDERMYVFDFVVPKKNKDIQWLVSLRPGAPLAVSHVMGHGLSMPDPQEQHLDKLMLFADSAQGIAAVRSFLEWSVFRSASCSGTVCRTDVVLYHMAPTPGSLAYSHLHGMWQVYGVRVIPLYGKEGQWPSLLKNMVMSKTGLLRESQAIFCTRLSGTANSVFDVLAHYALPRKTLQHLNQEYVTSTLRSASGAPLADWDGDYDNEDDPMDDAARRQFEEEVWRMWSAIRDGLRQEYEMRWQAAASGRRHSERHEKDRTDAWERWVAQNENVWREVRFDGKVWNDYWQTWGSSSSNEQSKTNWASPGGNYQSSKSQEYWDYVGRGTRNTSSRSYSSQYQNPSSKWSSGSQSAGRAGSRSNSSYQESGYRYEWNGGPGANQAGNNADWSNWSGKKAHGYNSNAGYGGRSGYGRSSNGYGSSGGGGGRSASNVDFYSILGISPGAGKSEIKKAYRSMAKKFHPDLNRGREAEVMDKMKNVVLAYTVLRDDSKRIRYDQHGSSGL